MEKGTSKPEALKRTVTKAIDGKPGGGRTRGSRKKKVAGDGPGLRRGSPQGGKEPKSLVSNNRFAWLKKGTGRSLEAIESTKLEIGTTPVSSIAGFELLCTYNWVATPAPTICVPGGPPQWKPVPLPTTLPQDSGTHFIDQNAFRAPAYPFEPMFAALNLMKPDFDFGGVDLVANRNSLRKLLNFASGRVPESFRIDVDLMQSTLFLTRRERSTRDVIRGDKNSGYGHNFERAFTEPQKGLEHSSAHHRVTRYQIGDLNCVVRFEVDAWCGAEGEEGRKDEEHTLGLKGAAGVPEVGAGGRSGDLLQEFMNLSLAEDASHKTSAQHSGEEAAQEANNILEKVEKLKQLPVHQSKNPKSLAQYKPTRVIPRGRHVPCSDLAEIKAKKWKARLPEALPQLWFGRTPLLLSATHEQGRFTKEVERINAGEKFEEWEEQQQEVLRKMVSLIGQLRRVANEAKGGACVVVCENKTRPLKLEVFENTARKGVLPEEIVTRYWRERRSQSGS